MGPDMRCNGGQHMVRTAMNNHYSALDGIRSTLNTQPKSASRPHSAKYLADGYTKGPLYMRPERIRPQINTMCPQSFVDLRDKLAKNKAAKLGDFHDREHQRNLLALKARLRAVGGNVERKKNHADPLNNPVRLFRNTADEAHRVSIQGFKSAVYNSTKHSKKKAEDITEKMLFDARQHSSASRIKRLQQ